MTNKNIEFAERTGTSVGYNISKKELFKYSSDFHKKLEEEAVTELWEAIILKDVEKLLDAYNDTIVYSDQWGDALKKAGIDVVGAQEAVALNNELKYTTSSALVMDWFREHRNRGNIYTIYDTTIDGVTYYCLKDKNNKVKKPVGHPVVDLTPFIPKHLLEVVQCEDIFEEDELSKSLEG